MKLYETHYTAPEGLHPLRIKGRRYNANTAALITMGKTMGRDLYRKRTGEFFLHLMFPGVGHYIAPLTEAEAEFEVIFQMKNGGSLGPGAFESEEDYMVYVGDEIRRQNEEGEFRNIPPWK